MTNRAIVAAWTLGIIALFGLVGGCATVLPVYNRYQSRQDRSQNRNQTRLDATNRVAVNRINIGYYGQELQIAQQQARIRLANAVGIREAQDEISKTLTPLYVQFEYIDALRQVATSGRNNTVIYIPTGPNGVPIVTTPPTSTKP